jgi:hypothetical protein
MMICNFGLPPALIALDFRLKLVQPHAHLDSRQPSARPTPTAADAARFEGNFERCRNGMTLGRIAGTVHIWKQRGVDDALTSIGNVQLS